MFRIVVVLANALAVGGAGPSALVHFMSFTGFVSVLSDRLFALAVLAVFPLGGFAIQLGHQIQHHPLQGLRIFREMF